MAKFDIDDDLKVSMGVEVSIGEYAPRGTVSITENGTHNVGGYKYADVDVEPEPQPLQSKTATPTESTQSIVPDENYYGLSEVTVNGISSTYVGTGIARNDSSNLTAIGSVVSGPSGYYSQAFSKAVDIGTIRQNGWSESVSGSNLNMYPNIAFSSGYISSSPSIERLFNVIEKTVTPSTSQIIVQRENANQWLSKIMIEPIPSEYIVPSGTLNITSGGMQDVTNYAYVSVSSGTAGKPYVMTEFRTNHTAVMTPLVTITSGYISGSTKMGDTLTVSASELASGTSSITTNGIYDITNYASVNVSVPTSGITPTGTYNITSNGIYDVTNYASASVSVAGGGGISVDDIAMETLSEAIGNSAVTVGSYAFYSYSSLTTASFPNATYIGDSAFYYCSRLTTVSFPSATSIGAYAFYCCTSLTTASFPNVTTIGGSAFNNCSSLTTASFPNATSIGNNAFYYCSRLTTVSFPSATHIGGSAFYCCTSLTTASFPNATSIGSYAFNTCSSLTTASFPNATSIGNYAFYYCNSLTTVSFPSATSIGAYAFYCCTSLTTVSFPNATSIGNYAFYCCTSLTTASFPNATSIGNNAFRSCYRLLSLYLLGSSVCTNGGTATFTSTPIAGYTTSTGGVYGSVFVPASLYDSYITATKWSAYSSRIVSLTDAEIEALSD